MDRKIIPMLQRAHLIFITCRPAGQRHMCLVNLSMVTVIRPRCDGCGDTLYTVNGGRYETGVEEDGEFQPAPWEDCLV